MKEPGIVDVVIPHYGDDALLEECAKSFEDDDFVHEMFVIDNNADNRGFTKAVNEGILMSFQSDQDVPYVMVVNNDTVALEAPIGPMVERMQTTLDCAVVGPKIVSYDDHDHIIHAGGLQCFPNGVHKSGFVSLGQLNDPSVEKWLSFVVVLMRKDAIKRVGLLDEKMFLIGSDSDWCYRARYCDYQCWYEPKSVWAHKVGESGKPTSRESLLIQRRDMYRFYKKWIKAGGLFQELDLEVLECPSQNTEEEAVSSGTGPKGSLTASTST